MARSAGGGLGITPDHRHTAARIDPQSYSRSVAIPSGTRVRLGCARVVTGRTR